MGTGGGYYLIVFFLVLLSYVLACPLSYLLGDWSMVAVVLVSLFSLSLVPLTRGY